MALIKKSDKNRFKKQQKKNSRDEYLNCHLNEEIRYSYLIGCEDNYATIIITRVRH